MLPYTTGMETSHCSCYR